MVRLSEPGSRDALLAHSPAGKVPVLEHGPRVVWDSLAIVEYLAEQRPAAGLWPDAADARALAARSRPRCTAASARCAATRR